MKISISRKVVCSRAGGAQGLWGSCPTSWNPREASQQRILGPRPQAAWGGGGGRGPVGQGGAREPRGRPEAASRVQHGQQTPCRATTAVDPVDIAIVRTTQRKNVQPWPDLPEYVFLRRMRWTRPCPTCSDSAACHKKCIQDAMLCAGCDGGQHTVDQHTAAGCCAGRMPRIADACSSCGLDTEKCGRRCSSTDAVSGQDGLAAILRSALREDTEDTGGFVVVVVV